MVNNLTRFDPFGELTRFDTFRGIEDLFKNFSGLNVPASSATELPKKASGSGVKTLSIE